MGAFAQDDMTDIDDTIVPFEQVSFIFQSNWGKMLGAVFAPINPS